MGFLHITLKGDALGVINKINLDSPDLSLIDAKYGKGVLGCAEGRQVVCQVNG